MTDTKAGVRKRIRFVMSRVLDSEVCVCESTSGAEFAPESVCLKQGVALGEGDSVSCGVCCGELVLVHVCKCLNVRLRWCRIGPLS